MVFSFRSHIHERINYFSVVYNAVRIKQYMCKFIKI